VIDGEKVGALGSVALEHEERWREEVSFAPVRAGPDQKVGFWLYEAEDEDVFLKTHLWVDVKDPD